MKHSRARTALGRPSLARRLGSVALLLGAASAHAQAAQPAAPSRATDTRLPAWMLAWSPLAPIADHPRALTRAPHGADLLTAPSPSIGAFWTAGNPGAIAFDIADSTARFAELRATSARESGSYRRPLDPARAEALQLSGLGWRPVGTRGAAVGRVVADQEELPVSAPTWRVAPYVSNPLVIADTVSPPTRHIRARLEGAIGWRARGWGAGLATGVETRDFRTRDFPLRRVGRVALPGATLGVTRALPVAQARVGAYARWTASNETGSLTPRPLTTAVFPVQGYEEPESLRVEITGLLRRIETDARAAGGSLSLTVARTSLALYGERTRRREDQFSQLSATPATDRWRATGAAYGAAAQRALGLLGARLLVTATTRYTTLDGDATRADLAGTIFRAAESTLAATLDVRLVPRTSPWSAAVIAGTARDSYDRRDFVAELASDVEAWTPHAALEVARSVGASTRVSFGYGATQHVTTSRIPSPAELGPAYRRLAAPELALTAGASLAHGGSLAISRRARRSTVWLRARAESLRPGSGATLSLAPAGSRTLWNVSLGVNP
ncbi:MAG: hypothetical protein WKG32_19150 [Gemmatimonadaceae bacterium]